MQNVALAIAAISFTLSLANLVRSRRAYHRTIRATKDH
ncbi:hypothetical protein ABH931_006126 [Streptacidiphilus sp. MAP12-33]